MFLSNLKISRKLMLAFAAVFLAIGAMGGTLLWSMQSLGKAGDARSVANRVVRNTAAAEFSLARQENSFRGYVISVDPYYIERANKHRATFKGVLKDLRADADAEALARIDETERAADIWFTRIVEAGEALAGNPATHGQAVALIGRDGPADDLMGKAEEALDALKTLSTADLDAAAKAQDAARKAAELTLMVGLAIAGFVAMVMGWLLSRAIGKPVVAMTAAMRRLAAGDKTIEVPALGRKDEIGEMAEAVLAFKQAAIEKDELEAAAVANRTAAEQERARNEAIKAKEAAEDHVTVGALGRGLSALAAGDLTYRIEEEFADRSRQLKTDFNAAMGQLQDAMGVVVSNVRSIRS
ncbi:MAG TPA: HAMP domain-containing protein, partial [Caulobacteraceae bacterium]|nr:HAMP domain-containing protein [Caulobacteraceae bacterium]